MLHFFITFYLLSFNTRDRPAVPVCLCFSHIYIFSLYVNYIPSIHERISSSEAPPANLFPSSQFPLAAVSYIAASRCAERDDSNTVKVVVFNECVHYPRFLSPPDRISDIYLFVAVQRDRIASYLRPYRRIVLLNSSAAFRVIIVQVFAFVFISRLDLIDISALDLSDPRPILPRLTNFPPMNRRRFPNYQCLRTPKARSPSGPLSI